MRQLCVIGSGYVGLVTGACFADLGNTVTLVDIDERKIEMLQAGQMPIYEPGLAETVLRNTGAGRMCFTTSYEEGLHRAEFVFVCVGTPSGVDGEADLQYVRAAAQTIAETMRRPLIVINKSTVPVGTGDWTTEIISSNQPQPVDFAVVSCPEFLREGSALADFMQPDRTVLGSTDRVAAQKGCGVIRPVGCARRDHRYPHGGDDQVRFQRVPGDAHQLYKRDQHNLRTTRRRRDRSRARYGFRPTDWSAFLAGRRWLWGLMFPQRRQGLG